MKTIVSTLLVLVSSLALAAGGIMLHNPTGDLIANSNHQMARYQELTLIKGRTMHTTDSLMVGQRTLGINLRPTKQGNLPIVWGGGYRITVIGEDRIGKDVTYILAIVPLIHRDRSPPAVKDELFVLKFTLKADGMVVPGFEERKAITFIYGNINNVRELGGNIRVFKGNGKYTVKYKECEVCPLIETDV